MPSYMRDAFANLIYTHTKSTCIFETFRHPRTINRLKQQAYKPRKTSTSILKSDESFIHTFMGDPINARNALEIICFRASDVRHFVFGTNWKEMSVHFSRMNPKAKQARAIELSRGKKGNGGGTKKRNLNENNNSSRDLIRPIHASRTKNQMANQCRNELFSYVFQSIKNWAERFTIANKSN